jgi:hypothetical protein
MARTGTLPFTLPYMAMLCAVVDFVTSHSAVLCSSAGQASLHAYSETVPGTLDNSGIEIPLKPHHFYSKFRSFGIPVKQASKCLLDVCHDV